MLLRARYLVKHNLEMVEIRIEGAMAQDRAVVKEFWSVEGAMGWVTKHYPILAPFVQLELEPESVIIYPRPKLRSI